MAAPCEGALNSAEGLVGVPEQDALPTLLVQLAQQVLEQWQKLGVSSGLLNDAGCEGVTVVSLELESGALGRLLDDPAKRGGLRRKQRQDSASLQHAHQLRLSMDLAQEVAPHGGDNPGPSASGECFEHAQDRLSSRFPGAGRLEQLLELVDENQQADVSATVLPAADECVFDPKADRELGIATEAVRDVRERLGILCDSWDHVGSRESLHERARWVKSELRRRHDQCSPRDDGFVDLGRDDLGEQAGPGERGLAASTRARNEQKGATVLGLPAELVTRFDDLGLPPEEDRRMIGLERLKTEERRPLPLDVPEHRRRGGAGRLVQEMGEMRAKPLCERDRPVELWSVHVVTARAVLELLGDELLDPGLLDDQRLLLSRGSAARRRSSKLASSLRV